MAACSENRKKDNLSEVESLFSVFDETRQDSGNILTGKYTLKGRSGNLQKVVSEDGDLDIENKHIIFDSSDEDNDDNSGIDENIASPNGKCDESLEEEENGFHQKRIRELEKELEDLKQENDKYKRQLRIIQPDRFMQDKSEGPTLQILYMNHSITRSCMSEIEKSVSEILRSEFKEGSNKSKQHADKRISRVNLSRSDDDNNTESCTVIGAVQFYENYSIDLIGWPLTSYDQALSSGWEIPKYSQQFKDPLPCAEEDEEDDGGYPKSAKRERYKMSCFNCGGDHTLNDCKTPRNMQKIRAARLEFQQKFSPSTTSSASRYHVETDPRFSSFKPGVISDKLKDALGMRSNSLPPYIYQMRLLGYPPGHLKSARIQESGLTMFDKHGCEVLKSGESLEEGEVNEEQAQRTSNKSEDVYDLEMLIEYPGFNVNPPSGTIDEAHRLGMPPMHPRNMKEAMLRQFKFQERRGGGVKRSLEEEGERRRSKQRKCEDGPVPVDMDLEEENEEDPLQTQRDKTSGGQVTPSLVRLQDLPMVQDPKQSDLSADDIHERNRLNFAATLSADDSEEALDDSQGTPSLDSDSFKTPLRSRLVNQFSGSSLGCSQGTPVFCESFATTPVGTKGLPDGSLFAKGMEEHIMFENLPNATGTYEKLRTVLARKKTV